MVSKVNRIAHTLIIFLATRFASSQEVCEEGNCLSSSTTGVVAGDIYQQIWDADQGLNGVPAILPSTTIRDEDRGYVEVDESEESRNEKKENLNVISKVVIPRSKIDTYTLCSKLFDNYTLDSKIKEEESKKTRQERTETQEFIDAIFDSAPMTVARQFIESQPGQKEMSDDEWKASVYKIWFQIFDLNNNVPHRSGFEHVFVGEESPPGSKLGGYHFWWKYYLDDQSLPGYANEKDNMRYGAPAYSRSNNDLILEGLKTPEVVTLSHQWDAYDFENGGTRTLNKKIGGFFVGCSPEGLIALGMARFYDARSGVVRTKINNATYELKLFKKDGSINTFYPVLKLPVVNDDEAPAIVKTIDASPLKGSSAFIAAAFVNPSGDERSQEWVSIANYTPKDINLAGWTLEDQAPNRKPLKLSGVLSSGNSIRLSDLKGDGADGGEVLLTNGGGSLTLKDSDGTVVDVVNWTKTKNGSVVTFNPF